MEIETPCEQSYDDLRRYRRQKKILDGAKTRLEKLSRRISGGALEIDSCTDSHLTGHAHYSDPEVEPNAQIERNLHNLFFEAKQDKMQSPLIGYPNIFKEGRVHIFLASCITFALSLCIKKHFLFFSICLVMLELILFRNQSHSKEFVKFLLPFLLLFMDSIMIQNFNMIWSTLTVVKSFLIDLAVNIVVICGSSFILGYLTDNYSIKTI